MSDSKTTDSLFLRTNTSQTIEAARTSFKWTINIWSAVLHVIVLVFVSFPANPKNYFKSNENKIKSSQTTVMKS